MHSGKMTHRKVHSDCNVLFVFVFRAYSSISVLIFLLLYIVVSDFVIVFVHFLQLFVFKFENYIDHFKINN